MSLCEDVRSTPAGSTPVELAPVELTLVESAPAKSNRPVASIWRLTLKHVDPLVVINHGSVDPHVYCLHPVTGDVAGLRTFAALFGDRRVHGIQVPKAQMTGASASSIEAMAARYVAIVTQHQPEGPINLLGWSAGAITALEMARQLRALGRDVPLVVALDGAPCNTGAGLKAWDPRYLFKLAVNLPRWIRDDSNQDWSWRGIGQRIESKLAYRFGIGTARLSSEQTLDAETVRKLVEQKGWHGEQKAFIHAMYKAMINYVPAPYPGRVIVYETQTQPLFHLRQIGAAWRSIAADIEIVPIRGNHSGMIGEPAVGVIARHLVARLDELSRAEDVRPAAAAS